MSHPKITPSISSSIIILFLSLLLVVCILPVFYYTIFPEIDRHKCFQSVAGRLGINPNYEDIRNYIVASLPSGMTRIHVRAALEKIGPVDVHEGQITSSPVVSDQIWLRICTHPFNNIWVIARYSQDEKLISADVEDSGY